MENEGEFEDLGDEDVILDGNSKHTNIIEYKCKYTSTKYDLWYEGAVLHETGKADHDEGSCEQTPSLGLHPAGAVHSCPVDLGVLDQGGFSLIYLENEPVVGMEEKKDPTMLQAPSAIIS